MRNLMTWDAPENTPPACRTAVVRGFGFASDVDLSADGREEVGSRRRT